MKHFGKIALVVALLVHVLRKEKGGLLAGGFALLFGLACLAPMVSVNSP